MSEEECSSRIEELLADRGKFESFIYTPWQDAIAEWKKRQSDDILASKLSELLPEGIPEGLGGTKNMMALFRNVATPNYEMYRFMTSADVLRDFRPVVLEFGTDRFNNVNEMKFALAKMCLHKRVNENGAGTFEFARILDINSANNKPLDSVTTFWGEPLIEFHHRLMLNRFPNMQGNLIDISTWVRKMGNSPREYYVKFLSLFLCNGVLFENFLAQGREAEFTKKVVLPALIRIREVANIKPLIINLTPTEIEGGSFWHGYPYIEKTSFEAQLKGSKGR